MKWVAAVSAILNVLLLLLLAVSSGFFRFPEGPIAERLFRVEHSSPGAIVTDEVREVLQPGLSFGGPKHGNSPYRWLRLAHFKCVPSAREKVSNEFTINCENLDAGRASTDCHRHWMIDITVDKLPARRIKNVFAYAGSYCDTSSGPVPRAT